MKNVSLQKLKMHLKNRIKLDTGHREANLVLTRKLAPCWLVFTVLKGVMQTAGVLGSITNFAPVSCRNDHCGTICPWVP